MFSSIETGMKSRTKLQKVFTKNEDFDPIEFQIDQFVFEAFKFDVPIDPLCVYNEWPTTFEILDTMSKMLKVREIKFTINSTDLRMFKDVPTSCKAQTPAIIGFLIVLTIAA